MARPHQQIVATAIVPALDIEASALFYMDLGFVVDRYGSDYAFVTYGGLEILHLHSVETERPCTVYLNVGDADVWHTRCEAAGHIPSPIENREWGMREFELRDPSGNTLRLGSNL